MTMFLHTLARFHHQRQTGVDAVCCLFRLFGCHRYASPDLGRYELILRSGRSNDVRKAKHLYPTDDFDTARLFACCGICQDFSRAGLAAARGLGNPVSRKGAVAAALRGALLSCLAATL